MVIHLYSTFLGGNAYDVGYAVAVDESGNAYIIGNTGSTNFPKQNAYQSFYGGGTYDVFVSKFSNDGSSLIFSTYLGGSGSYDVGYGISVYNNKACVTGYTLSVNFPKVNPYQSVKYGSDDGFITMFNSAGNGLEFSTYFGGSGRDVFNSVAFNKYGDIYLTGYTNSPTFPTLNAYQDTLNDSVAFLTYDAFVVKFNADPLSFNEIIAPGSNVPAFSTNVQTITFDSVETTGTVTVEHALSGPEIGANLTILPTTRPLFYNVSTDANFVGNVEVCFGYDPTSVVSEDFVKIYHYDNSNNWVDITTSLDTASNIVCGITDHFSPFVVLVPDAALGVEQIVTPNLPDVYSLSQNYPNPFNPSTTIKFQLKTRSHVSIDIYNILGRKVNTIVNGTYEAGEYQTTWNGMDRNRKKVSSGIYLYKLTAGDFVETKKMVLLK